LTDTALTPAALADLHGRCFVVPRPWSADEFADLLTTNGVFLLGDKDGFILGRTIADEAELLTLAVAPNLRRCGTGRRLVVDFARQAAKMGANNAFLEVAENNDAALALYRATGWISCGTRPKYYGPTTNAVVMSLSLSCVKEDG